MTKSTTPSADAPPTLVVRLRNWVGDVTLSVPALGRLEASGFALQLVGRGWSRELLAGHGWPVHTLPRSLAERVRLLRGLARQARAAGAPAVQALCLPDSFSSALEFRLAGLPAWGHAHEGRRWLLAHSLPRQPQLHALAVYERLADAVLDRPVATALPERIGLRVSARHRAQAEALRAAHGLPGDLVLICPFAGGTWAQQDKTWPGFAAFVEQVLPRFGRPIVVCPGPGEADAAAHRYGRARCLPGVDLGTYAALLEGAALMLANDTGPGHMAAALGTPLVSVLGPSEAGLWRAWGPSVRLVQGHAGGWPAAEAVEAAVAAVLA